jgi:hypothetical protein
MCGPAGSRAAGRRKALLVALLWGTASAGADSLRGSDVLLCSASEVSLCAPASTCEVALPSELGIPQFVVVDLKRRLMATTAASGEDRSTAIRNLVREDGHIYLQGVEMGRAFSMVLREESGDATISIAADGLTLGVFGACTPKED